MAALHNTQLAMLKRWPSPRGCGPSIVRTVIATAVEGQPFSAYDRVLPRIRLASAEVWQRLQTRKLAARALQLASLVLAQRSGMHRSCSCTLLGLELVQTPRSWPTPNLLSSGMPVSTS